MLVHLRFFEGELTTPDRAQYGSKPWYRHVAAVGGVANVLLMMTANLVGFVVGVDGAKELWKVMLGGWEGAFCQSSLAPRTILRGLPVLIP